MCIRDRVSVLVEKFAKDEKDIEDKRTMALINKPNYSLLQSSLKIDDLIDPRMTTVSSILKHIHKGTIENAYTISDGEFEVIEAEVIENSELINVPQSPPKIRTKRFITKSICYHAALLANDISAKAVSTLTNSGYTAFQISAWRPQSHILVFTSNKRILNQLSLLWGVKTFYYDNFNSTDKTIEEINDIAEEKGYVEKDDFVINLTAMPIKSKGMVNTLRVTTI